MKVFWSWQSDTPGRTGRHFVRDCLQSAIDVLNRDRAAAAELQEPTERDTIQLDHDRKGVKGSPGLTDTIEAKIRAASVVVCDVTPVVEYEACDGRRKMASNTNAAIEIGYARAALGDECVLMVLNLAHGEHEDLAFDPKHKTGILPYTLADDADNASIKVEKKRFTALLVEALRPYAEEPVAPAELPGPFVPMHSTTDPARWWQPGHVLFRVGEDLLKEAGYDLEVQGPSEPLLYFRLKPATTLDPIEEPDLAGHARAMPLLVSRGTGGYSPAHNAFGGISYAVDRLDKRFDLQGATQIFRNREIWSIDCVSTRNNPRDLEASKGEPFLAMGFVEQELRRSIPQIVRIANTTLAVPVPIDLELGLAPSVGYRMTTGPRSLSGPCQLPAIVGRTRLTSVESEVVEQAVFALLAQLWSGFGQRRRF